MTTETKVEAVARYEMETSGEGSWLCVSPEVSEDGEWVKFTDHQSALDALRGEVERLRGINTTLVDKFNRLNLIGAQSDQRADAAERRAAELLAAMRDLQSAESEVRIHEVMNPRSRNYRLPVYEAQRQARERLKTLTKESP